MQALAGGRTDDVDARFGQVFLIGEAHFAGAAAKQRQETLAEMGVDGLKGFGEFLA